MKGRGSNRTEEELMKISWLLGVVALVLIMSWVHGFEVTAAPSVNPLLVGLTLIPSAADKGAGISLFFLYVLRLFYLLTSGAIAGCCFYQRSCFYASYKLQLVDISTILINIHLWMNMLFILCYV